MDDMTFGDASSGMGFELLAASLRSDLTDSHAFLTALATKLEGALPGQTAVNRARDGLFKSTTHVVGVDVDLPPNRYSLADNRGRLVAARAKIVGGVAIKNETLGVDEWLESLARDLAAYAQSSAAARSALERLLT